MVKSNFNSLKNIAKQTRINILKMIYNAGSGHLGSSFSTLEVLLSLYLGGLLKFDPKNPNSNDRDYFLLSNGHACPALYTVLSQAGFFPKAKLNHFLKLDSGLEGHPKRGVLPGIETTSGSLGMGLSQGVGIALGLKMDNLKNKVIVMLSDGEQNEGSVWEAVMAASHYKLDNLTAVIDRNNIQIGGYTEKEMALEPLNKKYLSFNWSVIEINGHDFKQIFLAFKKTKTINGPKVIISKTKSCQGISFLEGRPDSHNPILSEKQFSQALKELQNA